MKSLAPLLLYTVVVCGCAQDTGLRIEIVGHGLQQGVNIDLLEVDVVASQTEVTSVEGREDYVYSCSMASEAFVGADLRFPVVVTVRPGEILWRSIGVRALGSLEGSSVIFIEDVVDVDLFAEVEVRTLHLGPLCLTEEGDQACGVDEICEVGECVAPHASSIFTTAPALVRSCDVVEATETER